MNRARKLLRAFGWDEEAHPRDSHGRFGEGDGGGASAKDKTDAAISRIWDISHTVDTSENIGGTLSGTIVAHADAARKTLQQADRMAKNVQPQGHPDYDPEKGLAASKKYQEASGQLMEVARSIQAIHDDWRQGSQRNIGTEDKPKMYDMKLGELAKQFQDAARTAGDQAAAVHPGNWKPREKDLQLISQLREAFSRK